MNRSPLRINSGIRIRVRHALSRHRVVGNATVAGTPPLFPAAVTEWPIHWLLVVCAGWLLGLTGCSSRPKQEVAKDSKLVRYVGDGREAFDEGDLDEAEKRYRRAMLRAWAIDDPYESGTVAYNLAACLTAQGELDAAENWLIDARVDLCRAKASAGNTWLLSAEIAMSRQCFDQAQQLVARAARSCPPCEVEGAGCLCGPSSACQDEACRECCIVKLPCIGKKIESKKADRECREAYLARVELARARLAANQYDVDSAKRYLSAACTAASDVCDLSLRADTHDVAALIHDAEGAFLQAGAHRDREIRLLRCIGQYRQIPDVLDAAAESYCQAERRDLAIDRLVRSARIRLARGKPDDAWQRVRWAGDVALMDGDVDWLVSCQQAEIRLGLTAMLIEEALAGRNVPDQSLESASGMAPTRSSADFPVGEEGQPLPEPLDGPATAPLSAETLDEMQLDSPATTSPGSLRNLIELGD